MTARNRWYQNVCFYHFFTFGVCNAPFKNPHGSVRFRMAEIEKWLPHLTDMQCNAVLFSPVFESLSHGYDTTDYYRIDSRIGDNESFKRLVEMLHNHNIRVVLDGVFNHCGRDFFAFRDVLANGRNSEYCSWFSGIDFNQKSPLGDPFCYDTWGGYYELPKFNLSNPQAVDYLLQAVLYWIDYFDIDGLRLDAADCLNPDFMKALRKKTNERKDDFWLMGEVVHGDYREWISEDKLHAVTNYEVFKGLYSSHNDQNLFEIAHSLNREFDSESGIYRNFLLYNFVDNHDQNRLASLVAQTSYLYTIYILLFTIPGIPSVYYGSEWGLKGVKANGSDSAIRPYIDIEQVIADEPDLEGVIKKLIQIRKKIPALRTGTYKQISIEYQKPFIFQRDLSDEHVIVMINATPNEHIINLEQHSSTGYYDILNNEQLLNNLNGLKITPYWGKIIYYKS